MRHFNYTFLSFAILFFSLGASAQSNLANAVLFGSESLGGVVSVTVEHQNAEVGDNVAVVINTEDITGLNVLGFQGMIAFNPAILQFNGCSTAGTIFNLSSPTCNLDPTPDVVNFNVFGTSAASGSGPIFVLNFTVIGSVGDVSPLDFVYFFFGEGDPSSVTSNGSITVVGSTTAAPASVTGQVLAPNGLGIQNALVIAIDDQNRTFTGRTNSFGLFRIQNLEAGRTYIVSAMAKGFSFPSEILTLNEQVTVFNVIAEGASRNQRR